MIKLSIIIPIYNAEKYLHTCLKSVIISDSKIEYILIDDGSTDRSAEIYQQFRQKNITIKKISNHGVSYARNLGLKLAKGKYVMFVDADDYLTKNWQQAVLPSLDNQADLIIFSAYTHRQNYPKLDLLKSCLGFGRPELKKYHLMSPWSKLYSRRFLELHHLSFLPTLTNGEDMLFNFEALLSTNKIVLSAPGFYFYRNNPTSATKSFDKNLVKSNRIFHNQLSALVKNTTYQKSLRSTIIRSRIYGNWLIVRRSLRNMLPRKKHSKKTGGLI